MLLRTPGHSFFHSSAWARVLSESYGYTPLYFTIIENGKLQALVPLMEIDSILTGKRGVSLPFTDYCEPIIGDGIQFQGLLDHVIDCGRKRGWKYIELRGGGNLFSRCSCSAVASENGIGLLPRASIPEPRPSDPVPVFITYLGHKLVLTKGEEKIFSSLRNSTRRNIKKATAQGVVAKISTDLEGIKEFYRLNSMTRRLHGIPFQPFHFFKKVHEYIISKNLGFVALAFWQKRSIAGAVFFHFGRKAIYKYGASDRKYQELRANNLIMWEGISWLCKHFHGDLCFGRTEAGNAGLRQFKNGWGSKECNLNYFRYDLQRMEFTAHQSGLNHLGTRLVQRMPLPVLNLAGSVLYRHIG